MEDIKNILLSNFIYKEILLLFSKEFILNFHDNLFINQNKLIYKKINNILIDYQIFDKIMLFASPRFIYQLEINLNNFQTSIYHNFDYYNLEDFTTALFKSRNQIYNYLSEVLDIKKEFFMRSFDEYFNEVYNRYRKYFYHFDDLYKFSIDIQKIIKNYEDVLKSELFDITKIVESSYDKIFLKIEKIAKYITKNIKIYITYKNKTLYIDNDKIRFFIRNNHIDYNIEDVSNFVTECFNKFETIKDEIERTFKRIIINKL